MKRKAEESSNLPLKKPKTISFNPVLIANGQLIGLMPPTKLIGCFECPAEVHRIRKFALIECKDLVHIILHQGISRIGAYAFFGCKNLTQISGLDKVGIIKRGSFASCSSLTSVILPNALTTIEALLFLDCSNLTQVTLPATITKIAPDSFDHCTALKYLIINDGNADDLQRIRSLLPKALQHKVIAKEIYIQWVLAVKEAMALEKINQDVTHLICNTGLKLHFFNKPTVSASMLECQADIAAPSPGT